MRAKGFSLIELIIVMAVMAVINMIMYPNFTSLQRSAKEVSAKSTARSVMVALEQYYFLNQSYPVASNGSIHGLLSDLFRAGLIDTIPNNPFTGQEYSDTDSSGKLVYRFVTLDTYQIQLYGSTNESVIFEYP